MLQLITSGESHGIGMIATVKGMPSNVLIDEEIINHELARRQSGYGRGSRMTIEKDKIEILSGVNKSSSTGSPITLVVWNKDWENWKNKETQPVIKPRPGHADLTGAYKYSLTDDVRKVLERSSARETTARVAGGALAKLFIKNFGIEIFSHVVNWGGVKIDTTSLSIDEIRIMAENSELRSACDEATTEKIKSMILETKKAGNTIGGVIETIISPIPPFLGSYQTFEQKLDARIASTVLGIQAVKGIEFGLGFEYANRSGKDTHDEIFYNGKYYRKTNRAGGLEGGMTNGQPIVFRAVMKPIPTLMAPLQTVNIQSKQAEEASTERSDVTAVAACGVVIENAVAFDVANAIMERYGGDDLQLILQNFNQDKALKEFQWK